MSRATARARAPGVVGALCLLAAGCADTVSPAAGGLRIGVQNVPLKPPMRADTLHPFVYPPSVASSGASGTTVLRILISSEGTVDSALVLESSGNEILDSAAVANAKAFPIPGCLARCERLIRVRPCNPPAAASTPSATPRALSPAVPCPITSATSSLSPSARRPERSSFSRGLSCTDGLGTPMTSSDMQEPGAGGERT